MNNCIVIITGPTCAGKSVLEEQLTKQEGFKKFVSHTTRKPRYGEHDGVHYWFCGELEFDMAEANGEFLEVVEAHGNSYGTGITQMKSILSQGLNPVIVMEPKGRDRLIEWATANGIQVMPIFLINPVEVIATRFIERILTEFATRKPEVSLDQFVATQARRLAGILAEETDWTVNGHPNEVVVLEFNAKNADATIKSLVDSVQKLTKPQIVLASSGS